MDLIITGPTNSGKTNLAEFIGTLYRLSIFNCDSIQVYKYLNSLTNKPIFVKQLIVDDELISLSDPKNHLDSLNNNFEYYLYVKKENNLVKFKLNDLDSLLNLIYKLRVELGLNNGLNFNSREFFYYIPNFIFDIKNPLERYSSFQFEDDLERISKKFNLSNKIICGGTIYYIYNYIFGINRGNLKLNNFQIPILSHSKDLSILKNKLYTHYPDLINKVDINNKITLQKLSYIIDNNLDPKLYFKDENILNNFALIIIRPVDKKTYHFRLEKAVLERFNNIKLIFDEIDFLISKYGNEIVNWLRRLSYEYRAFVDVFINFRDYTYSDQNDYLKNSIIILTKNEKAYAKRQLTFINRLIRKLNLYLTDDAASN